jgi:hypothetical protein
MMQGFLPRYTRIGSHGGTSNRRQGLGYSGVIFKFVVEVVLYSRIIVYVLGSLSVQSSTS